MNYLVLFFLSLVTLVSSIQESTVVIYNQEIEEGVVINGRNKNFYPVTVELTLDLDNMRASRKGKIIDVLKANDEKSLVSLSVADKSEKYGVKYNYTYYMGSIFAKHDDRYAYRLPFRKGASFVLDQGYNGAFSHTDDVRYALDFNMDEGTPVYASRNGVVARTVSKHDKGGSTREYMEFSNNITILHEDGTFADYSHLRKNGVLVKEGQRVKAGQHIGYSGSTGFATGPHLHFAVKKAVKGGQFVTIPVKFQTTEGIVSELEEGKSYTAY